MLIFSSEILEWLEQDRNSLDTLQVAEGQDLPLADLDDDELLTGNGSGSASAPQTDLSARVLPHPPVNTGSSIDLSISRAEHMSSILTVLHSLSVADLATLRHDLEMQSQGRP